jgi:hypothetical protein
VAIETDRVLEIRLMAILEVGGEEMIFEIEAVEEEAVEEEVVEEEDVEVEDEEGRRQYRDREIYELLPIYFQS